MTEKKADLLQVQLKVQKALTQYPSTPRGHVVAILGPVTEKEKLTSELPQRCCPTGFGERSKIIWLPKNKTIFYRFAIVHTQSSAIIEKEAVEARRAFIGPRPLTINCEYDEQGTFTIQVQDRIIRKGDTSRHLEMLPRIPKITEKYTDARQRLLCDSDVIIENRTEYDPGNAYASETDFSKVVSTDGNADANDTSSRETRSFIGGFHKYLLPVGFMATAGLTMYTIARFHK